MGLFFYFKKIEVKKHSSIPKDVPILFLGNHQNALLDPLIMAITSGRYAYFLTRAQVFKSPLVSKILKSLQLIPVYRIRDGWQNLSENNTIFSYCVELLNSNEAVTIFPEGSHNLKRTVRPLSKGFTRIVFEFFDKHPYSNLLLIPVGLNYENMLNYPDRALVNFGKPIAASLYNLGDKNMATKMLKADMHKAIAQLTTHIPSDTYDKDLAKLNSKKANFLQPTAVNTCLESNYESCDFKPKVKQNVLKPFFIVLLKIICFVPHLIWKQVVQPKIKELEFTSTFRFAIAITLVPLWLLLITVVLWFTIDILTAIIALVTAIAIALLASKL